MRIEIDCRKCANCTGSACELYGNNAAAAVKKCAEDSFTGYIKRTEEAEK